MAIETWYRGTATETEPSPPGWKHDLGDGLYLTDKLDVAYAFAGKRTTNSNEQTPYVMYGSFDLNSKGRVLDLTQGTYKDLWTKYESEVAPTAGITFRKIMSTGGGHYGNMFDSFIKINKINIDSFDIVIGPEYLNGGRQACIRNKSIASKIEDSLTIGAPPKSQYSGNPGLSPTGDIKLILDSPRGKANGAAIVAVFLIVDGLCQYLNSRFLSEDVAQQLRGTEKGIRDWQNKYPTDGALVSVNYARTEQAPDPLGVMKNLTFIHPGDRLEFIDVFYAPTPEEAAKQLREQRSWLQGDTINGPYITVRRRSVFWIAPRIKEELLMSPVGRWRVQVDKWIWIYEFGPMGTVSWTDGFNKETGQGTWKIENDHIAFKWLQSETVERWNYPLRPSNQKGICKMKVDNVFQNFPLNAVKI